MVRMKKAGVSFWLCHFLLMALVIAVLLPGKKQTEEPTALFGAMLLMEVFYIVHICRFPGKRDSASDILSILWALMLVWELLVSKLDLMHPVLVPALENIFHVFTTDYAEIGAGVLSSMELLFAGTAAAICAGTLLGLICGWNRRLREVFYPIANVLAPIPSIVFAPYVIAIMPSFRSASMVVIFLGIFWPAFLKTIISVESIDRNIIDSAKTLELSGASMVFEVLLPYSVPGIVKGLKVTMTSAVMMLTFAEMMGSTTGMGYYIVNYNTYGNYTKVLAGIIVVGVVVTILSVLITLLQKKSIKWRNY